MDECVILSRNGSHDLAFESNGLGLEGMACQEGCDSRLA